MFDVLDLKTQQHQQSSSYVRGFSQSADLESVPPVSWSGLIALSWSGVSAFSWSGDSAGSIWSDRLSRHTHLSMRNTLTHTKRCQRWRCYVVKEVCVCVCVCGWHCTWFHVAQFTSRPLTFLLLPSHNTHALQIIRPLPKTSRASSLKPPPPLIGGVSRGSVSHRVKQEKRPSVKDSASIRRTQLGKHDKCLQLSALGIYIQW